MNDDPISEFDFDDDRLIELFDELPFWSAPFGIKLLEYIKIKKGITALDIGFGAGFPLTEIAMRLGNSCKVYGIDPWKAAVKRTYNKLDFYGIKNVEIIIGEAENIPLNDESVNLITSNNGLNNVSDLQKSIAECSRIASKGAQFVQTVNLEGTMIEFYEVFKEVVIQNNLSGLVEKIDQHIYKKRMPLDDYMSLLEQNRFIINEVIPDKFAYTFCDGTTFLNHYFIRLAFLESWKCLVPAEKAENIFHEIEKQLNQIAAEKGGIKLSIPFVVIDAEKE